MEKKTKKYYKLYSDLFEKYGDPRDAKEKWGYGDDEPLPKIIGELYRSYKLGILEETIAAGGIVPAIKVSYRGNIDELINDINNTPGLDEKETIDVLNDINNLEHLYKLKESYPDKNIVVRYRGEFCFIDDAISAKCMIDYYKSIIDDELSPLEKITIAYDLVKSHYYKHSDKKSSTLSRSITKMVNTDNIVCVGFSRLFNAILSSCDISSYELRIVLDDDDQEEYHQRSIVNINDDKYGINGLFVFDPTFDSADKENYYKIVDNKEFTKSNEQQEGLKKADSMSLYKYFLIPTCCYEKRFNSSRNEELIVDNKRLTDNTKIQEVLHTNQLDEILYLSDMALVRLLYVTKLAEGYSRNELPELIQEILFISYDNKYTLGAIEEAINEIEQKNNEEKRISA